MGEWRCLASFFDGKSYLTTWANWRLVPRTLRCSILTRDVKDISGFEGHMRATKLELIPHFDGGGEVVRRSSRPTELTECS